MDKILVGGCSMTFGYGLPETKNNPNLWANKLFHDRGAEVNNIAKTGANNHWIFLETATALRKEKYDIVLVGWSAIPRYNFYVGLETYSTMTRLTKSFDINLNSNLTIPGKWLDSIGDNLRKISNDHWDILELIKYVNILIDLQMNHYGGQIFFVNTLSPWSEDYFTRKKIILPSDLSIYEQNLLEVDNRCDDEIFQLYNMIHDQYCEYGGIQESHWLNLYSSLRDMQIDRTPDGGHPGLKSQKIFVDYLKPILQQKIN